MKLRIHTLRQVSVIVSAILALLNGIAVALYGLGPIISALTALITFSICFFLLKFFIHNYALVNIRPLSELLLSMEAITSRLPEEVRKKVDSESADKMIEGLTLFIAFCGEELEKLEQQEIERTGFLRNLSHEIKTPVFNIEGYIETLLNGGLEDLPTARKFLARALKSSERLADIILDIDLISQFEMANHKLQKQKFDIAELTRNVLDENHLRASDHDITLKLDTGTYPEDQPVYVFAEAMRIYQVIENLISNAIKYSNDGSSVMVRLTDMDDKVRIEVIDHGIGIPEKDIPNVFDKLYRADNKRSHDAIGSGLGLSIVKLIVEAHEEKVTIDSKVGKGSTFSFMLSKPSNDKKNDKQHDHN